MSHGTIQIAKALGVQKIKMRYGEEGKQIFTVGSQEYELPAGMHLAEIIRELTALCQTKTS